MAKTEKSKAEIYREERKDRIAKAAKKNSKKSFKSTKAGGVLGKIVAVVLVIAIVGGLGFVIIDQAGVIARAQTALTIGNHKINVAEYGYLYYMQYQNTVSQAQQSEQNYGYNVYGFDYTKAPEDQDAPSPDEDGNTINWAQQLTKNTEKYLQEFYALYDNAIKEDYKLTDEEKANIDESIETQRKSAAGDGSSQGSVSMSLSAYLKANYGKGVNESMVRGLMEKEMIVQRYAEDKQKSFEDKYTDDALDKEYAKDTTEYDVVDMRYYAFDVDEADYADGDDEAKIEAAKKVVQDAAMKEANDFLAKVTDVESFKAAAEPLIEAQEAVEEASTEAIGEDAADEQAPEEDAQEEHEHDHDSDTKITGISKSSLTSSFSEDAANWALKAKVGAKKAFVTSDGTKVYALMITKPAYKQETVDVRHILFLTVDSENNNAPLTDDEIKEKEALKDEVWKKWKELPAAEKTEDAFADLANEYTEDPGSNTNGGLYEGVTPGQMVDSFNDWIFDASRKEGDTDVIESDYGWHIMYYVGNKDFAYRKSLRTTHTQDDYSSWLEKELESYKVQENAAGLDKGYERADRLIDAYVKYLNENANSSSYGG